MVLTFLVIAHHASQAYGPTGAFLLLKNKELPFFRRINMVHIIGLGALIGGISCVRDFPWHWSSI